MNRFLYVQKKSSYKKKSSRGPDAGADSASDLVFVGAKMTPQTIKRLTHEMHKRNKYVWGYYILGFENATYQDSLYEIEELLKLDIDYTQTTILTPFPMTAQWDYLDNKFGIFEKDWSKFDTKHLVWNHPNLTKKQFDYLLKYSFHKSNNPYRTATFIKRIYKAYVDKHKSILKGTKFVLSFPVKSYIHTNNGDFS